MKKIIAITGPSSSGKTALAINLAKELNGEIISVDSRQIYKRMDIGTAKPSKKEQSIIKHHMIDIVDLSQEYTAADYCDEAQRIIKEIQTEGKTVILAGGTGLYYRILLQDFDLPRVAPNKELRQELDKKSNEELYNLLLNSDENSAKKIHFNNRVKIIRALEVCMTLNIPMSKAQKKKETNFDVLWIGLNSLNRDFLYTRVNQRVDIMVNSGLIEEAEALFKEFGENKILLNTIGYQEFYPYFKGQIQLNDAIEQIKQNTRRYTKRQISWFNANKKINWFDIENEAISSISEKVLNKYKYM